jgi:hypothetical protein
MIKAFDDQRKNELRKLERYASTISSRVGEGIANAIKKAAREYIDKQYQKKIAQQYHGDPQDYEVMVSSVQATLEKIAERLNGIGLPSNVWQMAVDDIADASGIINLVGETPPVSEGMKDLRSDATWFVDKMLKRYSDKWKQQYSDKAEEAADSLFRIFDNATLPVASQEDIESGTYVPGVDKSMIEKLMLAWSQEVDPKLMQATNQFIADAKKNFQAEADQMNALVADLKKTPEGQKALAGITYEINAALSNEYGYNKDFRHLLKKFTPNNMPAIIAAVYMSGALVTSDFTFRDSGLAEYERRRTEEEGW